MLLSGKCLFKLQGSLGSKKIERKVVEAERKPRLRYLTCLLYLLLSNVHYISKPLEGKLLMLTDCN